MPIPYFPRSRRRPHYWKLRNPGMRELLLSKNWGMCGGYASKFIAGREVMTTTVKKHDDYILCCFQLKDDFWSKITEEARAREAAERRAQFRVIPGDSGD